MTLPMPPRSATESTGQVTGRIATVWLVKKLTLPGINVIAGFVEPGTTVEINCGKFVVAVTVVVRLERTWRPQRLVGRMKKSPNAPGTNIGVMAKFVVTVGSVPAGANGF